MVGINKSNVISLRKVELEDEVPRFSRKTRIGGDARVYPVVSTPPRLPAVIPDELLDYYGWVFCQGGFVNLQMTFEGFLAVVQAVNPSGLRPAYETDDLNCVAE